jgi:hypothetical protein
LAELGVNEDNVYDDGKKNKSLVDWTKNFERERETEREREREREAMAMAILLLKIKKISLK